MTIRQQPRATTQELMKMLRHPGGEKVIENYPFEQSDTALFCVQLNAFLERSGMTLSALGESALLSRSFVYQIGSGARVPSRDIVLRIALLLSLSVEETQHLLIAARRGALYPRLRRDAVLIYALERKLGLSATEDLLEREGEASLL